MRTPPLKALKVFEVVAYHLSVTEAAKELFVTPSAVSQQIRQLEQTFGEPLFVRRGKSMHLTPFGQQCLIPVREGFERVEVGLDEVYRGRSRKRVRVSVAPSIGEMWLLPRLDNFIYHNPDIDLSLVSSSELAAIEREDVDAAIRFGAGFYPGLASRKLIAESVIAVCSPRLARFVGNIDAPQSILNLPLIHEDPMEQDPSCPDWRSIAHSFKLDGLNWTRGLRLSQSSLVVRAAVADQGVALAKKQLAAPFLDNGTLVQAGKIEVPVDFAYYLVTRRGTLDTSPLHTFVKWLCGQAGVRPSFTD